jgi:hypothetical protein
MRVPMRAICHPQRVAATVIPRLYAANGTFLKEGPPVNVPAMSMVQIAFAPMFLTTPNLGDGFATFESDQPVFTYASIVDNQSSDQYFVPGVDDKEGVTPLPSSPVE